MVRLSKAIQNDLIRDPSILAVILFGSRARGDFRKDSDTDLCLVLMPRSYTSRELSSYKLRYRSKIDAALHIFQQMPIYIQQRVLKDGKVLWCRDEDALYEIAFRVIREFADYEHIYREYLEEVAHG